MLNEQLQQLDAYRINDRYFTIHPIDIADNEEERILQCIPYLPQEYRKLIADTVKITVPEFDILFAQFNQLCEHEFERYSEYLQGFADQVIDDPHADAMADLPF